MNELDILVRAEKYIADLANGIDPLTGAELGDEQIVNNVRISRCLFYVSGVLRKVIDNGGEVTAAPKVKPKRAELADFALTDEQAAALVPEKYDISLSKVAAVINRDIDENVMNKMKTTVISRWLMDKGLLTEIVSGGRNRKIPTPAGESIGMTEKQLTTASGVPYKGITYSPDAQQFIFDNIDSIAALAAAENAAKASDIRGEQSEIGWGRQIRSYVLQPYTMVKDLRTDVETSNVNSVLDGDIDLFINGYLKWMSLGKRPSEA